MKVSKFGRTRERMVAGEKSRRALGIRHGSFVDALAEKKLPPIDVEAVMEAVDRVSRDLRRNPTFEHLYRYKQAVRSVLRRLIKEIYAVEEKISYDPYGRRHLYVMVEKVDQQLEELTRLFLQRELPSLELARRLDEIRGMVLDLYT